MGGIKGRFKLKRDNFTLDSAFEIPSKGITAVFGDSGCGKTTLLRCVSGLEAADEGFLALDDRVFSDTAGKVLVPTCERSFGFVFQDTGLFVHLNVRQNLEYGYKRTAKKRRFMLFDTIVDLFKLNKLLDHFPHQLSGGQGQRVAMARALLISPNLLLMDEPMASLDEAAKAEIWPYLQLIALKFDFPVLYVSHSLKEITQLANYLLFMENGKITRQGPIQQLLTDLSLPLSKRDDGGGIIDGLVESYNSEYHLVSINIGKQVLTLPEEEIPIGTRVRIHVLAKDVSLALKSTQSSSILNILRANIVEMAELGYSQILVKLEVDGNLLVSKITRKSCADLALSVGKTVFAQVKSVSLHDFSAHMPV